MLFSSLSMLCEKPCYSSLYLKALYSTWVIDYYEITVFAHRSLADHLLQGKSLSVCFVITSVHLMATGLTKERSIMH